LVDGVAPQQRPGQPPQQEATPNNIRATTASPPTASEEGEPSARSPATSEEGGQSAPPPTTSEEGEQSAPQRALPEGERPTMGHDTQSPPREAAAFAALRRSSPGTPSIHERKPSVHTSPSHQTSSASSTSSDPSVSSTTTRATVPSPNSVPPLPTSTPLQPAPATTTPNRSVTVPSLIPMSFSPGGTGPRPANAPLPSPSIVYRTVPPRHAVSARPLATLPPTLTDAQLAQLDVLTREAIDERLRVLEGISSTMYRCVEELTRLRSVLPVASGPVPPAMHANTPSHPGQGQQGPSAVNENERAPDVRPFDSDLKSDAPSSNTKPTDVSGASGSSAGRSVEANGDTAHTPASPN